MNTSEAFLRTAMILGEDAEKRLNSCTVAVYGAGGVGGHCIEALARSGIGHIHITDSDIVSVSNLNRQCAATKQFMGMPKIKAMQRRVEAVSDAAVTVSDMFVLPENIESAVPQGVDFIVDAIDTVSAKIALAEYANAHNIPIIASMGMGNRLNPTLVRLGDLFDVKGCPLARVMRRELKKRGIGKLAVAYSEELPTAPAVINADESSNKKRIPGSSAFVPAAAGLAMAYYVVNALR